MAASKLLRSSSGFIPNFLHITSKNPKDLISEVKKGVLGGTSSPNLLSKWKIYPKKPKNWPLGQLRHYINPKVFVSHMKWGYLQIALGLHYSQKKFQAILRSWIFDPPPPTPKTGFFLGGGLPLTLREFFLGDLFFLA